MKVLFIGDIHNNWQPVIDLLDRYDNQVDQIFFTGDYFDDHGSGSDDAEFSAISVKALSQNPKVTMLMGNHDVQYRIGGNTICPGFSLAKKKAIDRVLTREDWNKLKYYTTIQLDQPYLISHAGFSANMFTHSIKGEQLETVLDMARCSVDHLNAFKDYDWMMDAGRVRGGRNPGGGFVWCDFNKEFVPFETIPQIFGHTPAKIIRQKGNSWCIDSRCREFLLWDDDHFEVINAI